MEYPSLPFTIFPSKTKLIWFLLMTAALTTIGVWMAISGDGFGWFVAAFSGLGALLFRENRIECLGLGDRHTAEVPAPDHGFAVAELLCRKPDLAGL